MRPAIRVSSLSKEFVLGEREPYSTLRETLQSLFRIRERRAGDGGGAAKRLWALKDVSFEIEQGEVVGIIGHNGAGKSTLLKILSRITEPSQGEVELFGRVSSLLEVGTGFHPELTGRENIYLNGSILGMKWREINAKFDEIVAFSGVERFLDTPVKRYSSGMQVRLAFAVAAHLEPEILLVDEVLAVGDAEFQRKCLGKMGDVARSGRTVLFVSHNMAAIENLCSRCLLLDGGRLRADGDRAAVMNEYLKAGTRPMGEILLGERSGARILGKLRILDDRGNLAPEISLGRDAVFEISGETHDRLADVTATLRIDSPIGQRVAACHTYFQRAEPITLLGSYQLCCRLENCRLMPGPYHVTVILKSLGKIVDQAGPIPFEVISRDVYGTGRVLPPRTGSYVPEASWHVVSIAQAGPR